MNAKLNKDDDENVSRIAETGIKAFVEQIDTLGLSPEDRKRILFVRKQCDDSMFAAIYGANDALKVAEAIDAYIAHLREDLRQLREKYGK